MCAAPMSFWSLYSKVPATGGGGHAGRKIEGSEATRLSCITIIVEDIADLTNKATMQLYY